MRRARLAIMAGAVLAVAAGSLRAEEAPLPDSAQLYRALRDKYRPMYEKYAGVESTSQVETRRYDSKSGALKETSQLLTRGRQYFYRKPERQVLKYVKDGVELDPDDADRGGGGEPMHPIWDAQGPSHYDVRVVGRQTLRGQPCYVLRISPRQRTVRHFEGTVLVNAETLDLVQLQGGMADVPFGVERISFKADLKQHGEISVYERFEMEAAVDIPLLYPDVRFVSVSTALSSRPIPR